MNKLPKVCNGCPYKTTDGMCSDTEGKIQCRFSTHLGGETE